MTSKISTETVSPNKAIGDNLNYSFNYVYDENFAHRLTSAGDRYYKYDANGNIVCEQDGSFESGDNEETVYHKITQESENVYSTDYGWGLFKEDDKGGSGKAGRAKYKRTYKWNERNQLVSSVDDNYSTAYIYGQDGQRSNKYTQNSETLYFNKMWTFHTDSGNSVYGGQTAKNIYLGDTRIVTKLNSGDEPTYNEEYYKQYYYHSDHLGSATLISDYKGDEYQRIEYTPYGETWVEKTGNTGLEYLPYRFTGKEIDEETGLYYYGARYLDPRYSRWISTDPALGEYIPQAPINDEAKKSNQNLPGMGGVFNTVNLQLYHYAGNNPIKYTDPDGKIIINTNVWYADDFMQMHGNTTWPNSSENISTSGCTLIAANRIANVAIHDFGYSMDSPRASSVHTMLDNSSLTSSNGMIFSGLKDYLAGYGVDATVTDTGKKSPYDLSIFLENAANSKDNFMIIGRIPGKNGEEDHFVNINAYNKETEKVTASDTSMTPLGHEKRNLKSVDTNTFDRLIIIKIKSIED